MHEAFCRKKDDVNFKVYKYEKNNIYTWNMLYMYTFKGNSENISNT